MTQEASLLERIAAGRREVRIDPDPDLVAQSVLRHLERLFNVRHGSVPIRPDYGLPDIAGLSHTAADTAGELRRAIKRAIDDFEPRLRNAAVSSDTSDDDLLKLRFKIAARMVSTGAKWQVSFHTRLDNDGRFLVES